MFAGTVSHGLATLFARPHLYLLRNSALPWPPTCCLHQRPQTWRVLCISVSMLACPDKYLQTRTDRQLIDSTMISDRIVNPVGIDSTCANMNQNSPEQVAALLGDVNELVDNDHCHINTLWPPARAADGGARNRFNDLITSSTFVYKQGLGSNV